MLQTLLISAQNHVLSPRDIPTYGTDRASEPTASRVHGSRSNVLRHL